MLFERERWKGCCINSEENPIFFLLLPRTYVSVIFFYIYFWFISVFIKDNLSFFSFLHSASFFLCTITTAAEAAPQILFLEESAGNRRECFFFRLLVSSLLPSIGLPLSPPLSLSFFPWHRMVFVILLSLMGGFSAA